ncbi:DUF4190 domain-containing protein [Kitasatospora sp. NBC_01302]|uniref:DUF4190 domain-containing protein n=1 Tax=Kitasatospora sp. NBC_01302 TaxID=2903575 RepID=UPI002E0D4136|nr:DUF4190 domain-containing protein [Kitasatospora sp. NBC_01302]
MGGQGGKGLMTAEDKQDAAREEAVSLVKRPAATPPAPTAAAEGGPAATPPAATPPAEAGPAPSASPMPADAPPADAPPAATPPPFDPFAPPSTPGLPPHPAAPGPYAPYPPSAAYPQSAAHAPYGGYWGPAPYPPPRTGVNGFAVAALVTALTCFLWPFGIAFGITGLVQIRNRRQRGTGLAVSGLVLSGLGLLATLGVVTTATLAHNAGGSFAADHGSSAEDLGVGDCFNRTSGGLVDQVSCTDAHDGEVVGHTLLTGQAYPDADARKSQVGTVCDQQAQNYAMDDWAVPDGMVVHYFYPEQASWDTGDRKATCFLTDPDEQHTGSVRKDAGNATAAQLDYLKAMDAIDEAASRRPSGSAADDPDGYRDWAGALATVLRTQTTELDAGSWDPDVRTALDAQLAELRQRIPALQQAAGSTGTGDLVRAIAQADQHRGYDQQKAVRQLLQLSTDESWLNPPAQGGASPRSDDVPHSV